MTGAEILALIGFLLWFISEAIVYTPWKGNGVIQQTIIVLRKIFPHETDTHR